MTRQQMDEYLDGALAPEHAAQVEAALRSDANAAGLLAKMKRERALRSAALGSFAPTHEEAESAAVRMIAVLQDEAQMPVARIGPWRWMKQAGSIAAVLALVAGAFVFGRATAPTPTAQPPESGTARTSYAVLYTDDRGEMKSQPFDSELEAKAFLTLQQAAPSKQAVASIDEQGVW